VPVCLYALKIDFNAFWRVGSGLGTICQIVVVSGCRIRFTNEKSQWRFVLLSAYSHQVSPSSILLNILSIVIYACLCQTVDIFVFHNLQNVYVSQVKLVVAKSA